MGTLVALSRCRGSPRERCCQRALWGRRNGTIGQHSNRRSGSESGIERGSSTKTVLQRGRESATLPVPGRPKRKSLLLVLPKLGHRTCWLALLCFGAVPLTPSDRDPASDTQVAVETTPGDQLVAGGRNPTVGGATSEGDPGSGLDLADSTRAASRPADADSPLTAGSGSASLTGSFPKAAFTLLPGDLFLTQDNGSTPGIVRVDPTTGMAVTVVSDPALSGISGIAIDASGRVLVTILNPPELRRVDPMTGVVSSLKVFNDTFFFNASDVAVEDDGTIDVADRGCRHRRAERLHPL